MLEEIPSLNILLRHLQQVPYLASKNLYRVADYFLNLEMKKVEQLCQALLRLKAQVKECDSCCVLQEIDRDCFFCSSPKRDQRIICVVETWQDVLAIEKTRGYQGVYHVLGGAICPLDGIGPEDLSIALLMTRASNNVDELIFATNQTPEGEATASFLADQLKGHAIKISCLSRGLPVGASLEAIDRLTLYKALAERRIF